MRLRLVLGAAGILLGLFGVFRLVTEIPNADLVMLAFWLIGALVIHDGILSPIVVGVGAGLARFVPPRGRRYLQGALVVAIAITVIAIPMIHRENSQPKSKAVLQQNFGGNLTIVLGIIAAVTLTLYAIRVARDRGTQPRRRPRPGPGQRPSAVNDRPVDDQISPTE